MSKTFQGCSRETKFYWHKCKERHSYKSNNKRTPKNLWKWKFVSVLIFLSLFLSLSLFVFLSSFTFTTHLWILTHSFDKNQLEPTVVYIDRVQLKNQLAKILQVKKPTSKNTSSNNTFHIFTFLLMLPTSTLVNSKS